MYIQHSRGDGPELLIFSFTDSRLLAGTSVARIASPRNYPTNGVMGYLRGYKDEILGGWSAIRSLGATKVNFSFAAARRFIAKPIA